MRKSLALQQELGPVFDITFDCEDGAAAGNEVTHARQVAELIASGRKSLRPRRSPCSRSLEQPF